MQHIWLDLWNLSSRSAYWKFIIALISELQNIDSENRYTIYSKEPLALENESFTNVILKDTVGLQADLEFMKLLKSANTNLVIFFDHLRKIRYKKRHYTFLESLQEVSYPSIKTKGMIDKYIFFHFLHSYIKKSEKILCFDAKTKEEINESFDKADDHIAVIPWFFTLPNIIRTENTQNEITMPDGMNHEYIIYEWGTWANKNLEKLIKAIVYIQKQGNNIMLYIIGDELVKDLQLREYMVQNEATNYIRFLWELEESEKPIYYTKALWVILPSLYESFPFSLSNAVLYNKKIITSNIKALKELFWETVEYFNPLSINQLSEKLLWIKNQPEPDYSSILKTFTARKSAQKLLHEIEN